MKIGNRIFDGGTHVMGILNLTPDSFYAGSRVSEKDILLKAERMIEEGAELLDVGAQSTRPGHVPVSPEEEISRLAPIRQLRSHFEIPISVDTYFSSVAEFALSEGADLVNDVWGLQYDEKMAEVIARHRAAVCIMHNQNGTDYFDFWGEIKAFLQKSLLIAKRAGISPDRICLDGGIGFGKTGEQNFELLNGYERLSSLGYPLLLGVSRKSMFGGAVEDRLAPTLKATELATKKGILFVRVHDVKENKEAITRANRN